MTNSDAMENMFAEIDSKTNFRAEYRKAEPTEGAHVVTLKNVSLLPAKLNQVDVEESRDPHTGDRIPASHYLRDESQAPDAVIRPETLVFTFKDDTERKAYTAFLSNYKLPDKLIKTETDPSTLWDKFMDSLAEQNDQFLMLPMSGVLKKMLNVPFTIWAFKDTKTDTTRICYSEQDFDYYTKVKPATETEHKPTTKPARKTTKKAAKA